MNLSKLSGNDRLALGAAVVVILTALLSLSNGWGVLMGLSLLAGIGVLAVLLLPELSPTTKLPAPKGVSLLVLGATATVSTALVALNWIGWIADHPASFDAIQFLVGLVAAVVMLWAGYTAYRSERGPTTAPPV